MFRLLVLRHNYNIHKIFYECATIVTSDQWAKGLEKHSIRKKKKEEPKPAMENTTKNSPEQETETQLPKI